MSISSSHIHKWIRTPSFPSSSLVTQTQETVSQIILIDEHFTSAPHDIFGFSVILILSSRPLAANRLLSTLFKIPEFTALSPGQLPQFFSGCKFYEKQKLVLELWWSTIPSSGRPEHTPWKGVELVDQENRRSDTGKVEWWEEWTKTNNFATKLSYSVNQSWEEWTKTNNFATNVSYAVNQSLNLDARPLENTDPLAELAARAKLLCKPKNGEIPSKENAEEAFEAIDELFTTLSEGCRHIPIRVYFILALYLGKEAKAVEILTKANSSVPGEFQLHQFLDIPQLYHILARHSFQDPLLLKLIEDSELVKVEEELIAALHTRIERG